MDDDKYRQMTIRQVADLDEQAVLETVQKRLAEGDDPLKVVEDSQEGLRQVGVRYEQGEYYIAGLIMAGEIFRQVMELVQPAITEQHEGDEEGRILLGTVAGDIHDIGKNNLSLLLRCYGFTVRDLGVDVPPAQFLQEALRFRPDLIGLSGLLTTSFDAMEETIALIRSSEDGQIAQVPIIIGGSQVNAEVCQYVGADHWVVDAMQGVRLCQRLLA
ncbi:MAG: cobalamin-dependent protein [Candidatus Promineifilaceae bacterium]|nr:cobalamin-dependent protein [Candidatus Promineifilaceae bacterium]